MGAQEDRFPEGGELGLTGGGVEVSPETFVKVRRSG